MFTNIWVVNTFSFQGLITLDCDMKMDDYFQSLKNKHVWYVM
jgi:hypothetical protein